MQKLDLIVASGNQDKIKEIKSILSPLGFHIKSMKEIGIDTDIPENGKTFEENALIKARALVKKTGKIALADDSGLEVMALDNAPGIYSARYAGDHGDDEANNKKLLERLKDIPMEKRQARFYCAIALVYPNGEEIIVNGECRGIIGSKPEGDKGFGYDPLFIVLERNKTFAQLKESEKNKISHRAMALNNLKRALQGEEGI